MLCSFYQRLVWCQKVWCQVFPVQAGQKQCIFPMFSSFSQWAKVREIVFSKTFWTVCLILNNSISPSPFLSPSLSADLQVFHRRCKKRWHTVMLEVLPNARRFFRRLSHSHNSRKVLQACHAVGLSKKTRCFGLFGFRPAQCGHPHNFISEPIHLEWVAVWKWCN